MPALAAPENPGREGGNLPFTSINSESLPNRGDPTGTLAGLTAADAPDQASQTDTLSTDAPTSALRSGRTLPVDAEGTPPPNAIENRLLSETPADGSGGASPREITVPGSMTETPSGPVSDIGEASAPAPLASGARTIQFASVAGAIDPASPNLHSFDAPIRQIAAAIAADPASGQIDLRLDPPELGAVEILLDVSEDRVKAIVSAERQTTSDALRRHGDLLAQAMRDAGFEGLDLDFGTFHGDRRNGRSGHQPLMDVAGDQMPGTESRRLTRRLHLPDPEMSSELAIDIRA